MHNISSLDDYINIYEKEIMPKLSDTEKERKKLLLKYIAVMTLLLSLFVLSIKAFYIIDSYAAPLLIIMFEPFIALILLFFYWRFRKEYPMRASELIKNAIYPKLFNILNNIRWVGHNPNKISNGQELLSDYDIQNSLIFDNYGARCTDDEFKGSYQGAKFTISEIKLYENENSKSIKEGGREMLEWLAGKYVSIDGANIFAKFRGVALKIKFDKPMYNDFSVKSKRLVSAALLAMFCPFLIFVFYVATTGAARKFIFNGQSVNTLFIAALILVLTAIFVKIKFRKKSKVKESEEEGKNELLNHYKIIDNGSSEIGIQFLESLYKLEESFDSKELECAVKKDEIMVAIRTNKNLFEVGNLFNTLYNKNGIREFYNQLNAIYELIDCIKNNNISNKEINKNEEKVQDIIQTLDKKRNTEVKEFYSTSIICAIVWIASIVISIVIWAMRLTFDMEGSGFLLFLWIASISASALIPIFFIQYFGNAKNKIGMESKKRLVPEIIKNFDNIKWISHVKSQRSETTGIIDEFDIDRSGLFMSFSECYIDDEFKGVHKNIPFYVSEINLCKKIHLNRRESYISVFDGIIINFETGKKITNRTIVTSKGSLTKKNDSLIYPLIVLVAFLRPLIEKFSITFAVIVGVLMLIAYIIGEIIAKKDEPLDKINLEDPIFQKKFNAYSSDQVEARCLLTPVFMQKITNLKKAFGAKKIKCSFYNKNFMIAMETRKNAFEIGNLFKSLNDQTIIKNFVEEIKTIYDLIDYFKLDK